MFQWLICKLNTLRIPLGQFCTFLEFPAMLYLKQIHRALYNNIVHIPTGDNITTVAASFTFPQICESATIEIILRLFAQCSYLTIFNKQVSEFH